MYLVPTSYYLQILYLEPIRYIIGTHKMSNWNVGRYMVSWYVGRYMLPWYVGRYMLPWYVGSQNLPRPLVCEALVLSRYLSTAEIVDDIAHVISISRCSLPSLHY